MPLPKNVLIEDEPYLMGSVELWPIPLFTINPGDKITQIGQLTDNGKQSSSCRVCVFKTYVTYMGVWTDDEKGLWMAFKIPAGEIVGTEETVYKLFNYNSDEIFIPLFEQQSLLIYKPIFTFLKTKLCTTK